MGLEVDHSPNPLPGAEREERPRSRGGGRKRGRGGLLRPENRVCGAPPCGPARVVDAGISGRVVTDESIGVGLTEEEFVYEGTHLAIDAGSGGAMVMASDNVKTKSVGYTKGIIDPLNGPAGDVAGRVSQPGKIRVSGGEERAGRNHGT